MSSGAPPNLIKRAVPRFLRLPLGKLRVGFRRLSNWLKVTKYLKGVSRADSVILRQALFGAPISVWRDLGRWQFPAVRKDCAVVSRGVGIFKIRGRTDDLFHVLPGQEPAVEGVLRSRLQPGDTFIDAGANIGFYTVLGSQLVGPEGHVISCEMIPVTAGILRQHVRLNDCRNVTVKEGALAATAGDSCARL